jgi:hypothetical protein
MTAGGVWSVELPALRLAIHARFADGRVVTARPAIDTVLVEPIEDRVELSVRHAFPAGRGKTALREIRVDTDD